MAAKNARRRERLRVLERAVTLRCVRARVFLVLPIYVALFAACPRSEGPAMPGMDSGADALLDSPPPDVTVRDGSFGGAFCDLPGSIVHNLGGGTTIMAGGPAAPDLTWMTVPPGFCVHYFAHVPHPRQLRVAPSGELFVASPATSTAGGGGGGVGGVVLLTDDNFDGFADGDALPHPGMQAFNLFLQGLPSTQGIMFAPGFFYYQDDTRIMQLPYKSGDRTPEAAGTKVADITIYSSQVHWPKTLDIADDGTIYVGNGGDQSETCDTAVFPRPFHGGILALDGSPGGTPVAQGFRNPIAVRCQRGHNLCFATELALDGSGAASGREKIVPIHRGDDWGYPCCATQNTPYGTVSGSPNCGSVASESTAFIVGHTPFGIDFEPGTWPAPFTNNMIVALHGTVGTWKGARLVAIPTDANGMPIPTTELGNGLEPPDFAAGWDDSTHTHGRPAAVTFSTDGRLFLSNDIDGDIVWIAPVGVGGHGPTDSGSGG
jgi:glucose/arabinose dehydrogenase